MPKIRVAVIYGGTNTEHEVSLVSARGIFDNLNPEKYDIVPIKITKDNRWVNVPLLNANYQVELPQQIVSATSSIDSIDSVLENHHFDIVFPILHGPYGEDGTIQGLLELMRIPYVGCGVTASAVCMDKVLQKNICVAYNIPVAPYFWLTRGDWDHSQKSTLTNIQKLFKHSFPLFIKPANQGSSIGITKAHDQVELIAGIKLAFTRDTKVLLELAVPNAREIECAVLGDHDRPEASVLGEIIPGNEFYDYEAKYLTDNSSSEIPAKLPVKLSKEIRDCAKLAFRALDCYGLARVDFLLDNQSGKFYLNELNTMPGFTPISMYPKLWEATGLSYPALLDKLIALALTRHQEKSLINHSL